MAAKRIKEFLTYLTKENHVLTGSNPLSISWKALEQQGLIVPLKPATKTHCPHGMLVDIEWIRLDDKDVPQIYCPKCGYVQLTPDDIQRWRANIVPFLEMITEKFGIKGQLSNIVPGLLWSLGWLHSTPWFYLSRCNLTEAYQVCFFINQSPNAILVTGLAKVGVQASVLWPERNISIETCADMTEEGELILDYEFLKERGIDLYETKKKNNQNQERKRAKKIETLYKELKEFVNMAKNYAEDHKHDDNFSPLQRPTLKELSQRTGFSTSTISRCLNDEQATMLRMLWDRLEDPWSIL